MISVPFDETETLVPALMIFSMQGFISSKTNSGSPPVTAMYTSFRAMICSVDSLQDEQRNLRPSSAAVVRPDDSC